MIKGAKGCSEFVEVQISFKGYNDSSGDFDSPSDITEREIIECACSCIPVESFTGKRNQLKGCGADYIARVHLVFALNKFGGCCAGGIGFGSEGTDGEG